MKLGVLGKGRVGSALIQTGDFQYIPVDITNEKQVKEADLNQFDVIVNCAAKTNVDNCQRPGTNYQTEYFKEAVIVNVRALANIRLAFSGLLVHLSTDYVFDGKSGPYSEDDSPNPVNDYGFTKWGGEIVLDALGVGRTVIVRTTGLYSHRIECFASNAIKAVMHNEIHRAADDLVSNHTYIPHLCVAIKSICGKDFDGVSFLHVASTDICSRYQFCRDTAIRVGISDARVNKYLIPVKSNEIENWIAPRPLRAGLLVDKAKEMGIPLFSMWSGISEYVKFL